jgi:hypothetical protein
MIDHAALDRAIRKTCPDYIRAWRMEPNRKPSTLFGFRRRIPAIICEYRKQKAGSSQPPVDGGGR